MRVWIEIGIACQGKEGQDGWMDAMIRLRRQRGVCDYREGAKVCVVRVCVAFGNVPVEGGKKKGGKERASAKTEARTETGRVCACASLTTPCSS